MIKAALLGLWSSIVAVAAAYAGIQWSADAQGSKRETPEKLQKVANVRVKPISVPITRDGQISGYIIANFSYMAKADALKTLNVKPEIFLFDALLGALMTRQHLDYNSLDSKSLADLSKYVKETVNTRLGLTVVDDLITEEIGYIPFHDIRGRGADANGLAGKLDRSAREK